LSLYETVAAAAIGWRLYFGRRDERSRTSFGYDHRMPLYEYACRECAKEFETLVRGSETPACPACQGTNLERRLSVFAAHANGSSSGFEMGAPSACGACGDPRGPGACSMN
jgi:putative FmdB family regulatory protein